MKYYCKYERGIFGSSIHKISRVHTEVDILEHWYNQMEEKFYYTIFDKLMLYSSDAICFDLDGWPSSHRFRGATWDEI